MFCEYWFFEQLQLLYNNKRKRFKKLVAPENFYSIKEVNAFMIEFEAD